VVTRRAPRPPATPRRQRSRAFALVDVIVAAVLLGVSLAVMLGIVGRATAAQGDAQKLAVAAMLADEQLNLLLAFGPDEYLRRFPAEGPCDPPFDDYAYELTLTGGTDFTPFTATATIRWRTGARPQSLTISTLMAPRPGDDPDPDRRPQSAPSRIQ
jgi:type II secretory pathway pseudopilin PulG